VFYEIRNGFGATMIAQQSSSNSLTTPVSPPNQISPTSPVTLTTPPSTPIPSKRVRLLALELIQNIGLWTVLPDGTPVSKNETRVVSRVDLPPLEFGQQRSGKFPFWVPPNVPPTTSVRGIDISYQISLVGILGGNELGGGIEVRTSSEVVITHHDQGIDIPLDFSTMEGLESTFIWDDLNEDEMVQKQAVEAAVAQIKRMAEESQAEYESRVTAAQQAAEQAVKEAAEMLKKTETEAAAKLKMTEEEAARKVQETEEEAKRLLAVQEEEARRKIQIAEASLKAKEEEAAQLVKLTEEEAARVLKEKEEESQKLLQLQEEAARLKLLQAESELSEATMKLKLTEEETAKRLKAAEEAAAAARVAAEAARKANQAALSQKKVLPAVSGIPGAILGKSGLGLLPRASPLQMNSVYKDSAMFQLFKLYYFDLQYEPEQSLIKENGAVAVIVVSKSQAALRISKESVPNWLS
jgi:hypothetical protein